MKKEIIFLFCIIVIGSFILTGCFGGNTGESMDRDHTEEVDLGDTDVDSDNSGDNTDSDANEEAGEGNDDANTGDEADIELEPEVIELDVDDDGTGDINNPETMTENDLMDMVDATNELFEDVTKENDGKVKGSCNAIAAKSTCLDYMGAYWENYEYLKLNCTGPESTPSKNTCPYEMVGGCMSGAGTINEVIVWHYCSGGTPVCGENVTYMQKACDANPVASWVPAP